jgi:hypothetical protein
MSYVGVTPQAKKRKEKKRPVPQSLYRCIWRPLLQLRSAALVLALSAPVLAVARAAVPALALPAPVLAVASAAVLALVLLAPVLAVARAAVLALVLLAPVLALLSGRPALLLQNPKFRPLAVASTAACVCVLAVANFARKDFSRLRLAGGWPRARGWLPKRIQEELYLHRIRRPPQLVLVIQRTSHL